jgi:hypothetical protein
LFCVLKPRVKREIAAMDQRVAAFVHYYAREGQFHHVQTVCNEVLKRRASPALQLWRAYGLLAGGADAEVRAQAGAPRADARGARM